MGNGMNSIFSSRSSQTPDSSGYKPSEEEMFSNFLDRLRRRTSLDLALDGLHRLISRQKFRKAMWIQWFPTIGEVGLCTDFFQIAAAVMARTKRMEIGSAVMSILASGGPIAQAERVGAFLAIHGVDPNESRRLHIGFSAGRFEFMARPYGIIPRILLKRLHGRHCVARYSLRRVKFSLDSYQAR